MFLALACALIYYAHTRRIKPSINPKSLPQPSSNLVPLDLSNRVPVALNRGSEVLDGFRGDVHPLLNRRAELKVTANWDMNRNQSGNVACFKGVPPEVRDHFLGLEVSIPTNTYTERDFSRFLPAGALGAVGQMWALDLDKISVFLKQFHPNPSMRLVAKGRRPGPDGAFAILRAVSPFHFDILIRAHAEFDVRPAQVRPGIEAWFSPSCFLGRLLVDRKAGTVEQFWLSLPTDTYFNVHYTLADKGELHGWMHVDQMDLIGGSRESSDRISWTSQIEPKDAYDRLAKVFYKFKEIDWVPFDKVQEVARLRKKPILVVAALGALDN
ncbi:MAG: hypothetical protein ACRELG_22895, partial [Gemmataceae bacterium]